MKRIFTAAVAVAALAIAGHTQARATTFPSLTTIYFAAGVVDDDVNENVGIATFVSCANMSGQTASVRYLRYSDGGLAAGGTLLVANLATKTVTTQGGVFFHFAEVALPTGAIRGGTLQILSTQSAIYCSAMLINAAAGSGGDPSGVALHMVRLNPHPGTVE